jgi:hypothetical protein
MIRSLLIYRTHLVLVTLLFPCVACEPAGEHGGSQTARRSEMESVACTTQIKVTRAPATLPERDRCSFVTAAIAFLSRGDTSNPRLTPVDRSSVGSVAIDEWKFRDLADRPIEPYWTLEFSMLDRPYHIVVYRRGDGSMYARRGHR